VLRSYERIPSVPVLALLICLATPGSTPAQTAIPAAYPVAPDPSECIGEPASPDEIVAVLATPVAEPPGSPAPFVRPAGEPADAEISAEVIATLRQVFACANAGDALRVASFYTDDFVRDFFGGVHTEDLLEFLTIPPQPLPDDQKRIIIRFGEVQLLPDGRAGVVIVLDEPEDPRTEEPDYAILKRVEWRWLVDELHEDAGAEGTPAPGTTSA
jgi:hypothetical protein